MTENLPDTNVGNIEYISKQDAITAACKGFCHPGVRCPDEPCREQTKYLRDLHSADVMQVVHGKWIDTDNYYRRWKCSECGSHTKEAQPPFCPYCGAKMDKE